MILITAREKEIESYFHRQLADQTLKAEAFESRLDNANRMIITLTHERAEIMRQLDSLGFRFVEGKIVKHP